MAYSTSGLRMIRSGVINEFVLYTTDPAATALGSGYITDGGPTAILPGKGLQVGDKVTILVVDAIPASYAAPAVCYDRVDTYVSSINTTTGAATLGKEGAQELFFGIDLAASSTTDGMDITITVQDDGGNTIAAVHAFELFMSESSSGIGLTGDTYSGTLTAGTGAILTTLTAKKHFSVVTAATGIFVGTLVDSANPTDQYVVVKSPVDGTLTVSAASGTSWEGA